MHAPLFYGASVLWLIPALPALAALAIFLFASKLDTRGAARLAVAGVAASFAVVVVSSLHLLGVPGDNPVLVQKLAPWFDAGFLKSDLGFWFDRVTMVFTLVITGVGLLIHVYSSGYMDGDEGARRYFGFLCLFVSAMLVLVTADNGFFMLLGWEGVGACSFALIGHYYKDRANAMAALKAFVVTRLGDVFLILGLLVLARYATVSWYDTGRFAKLAELKLVPGAGMSGLALLTIAGLLLLGGAAGKSAQLPLQTWLPDAMAGPTPVSALIHAATMVTAGVYLIARFHSMFELSPVLMATVATVGAATALYGATCAIVQTDIKRILAFSTISQIGYMMLGLGVGAFSAGLFHFFTHAFYKALLFLGAGTIIHSLHGEQNVHRMGGLKGKLGGTYLYFLIGAAALAGFPLTSGFFSKDAILWGALTGRDFGLSILWLVGIATAFLTSVYSFRLVFLVFLGKPRDPDVHVHAPGPLLVAPLGVLAVFAAFAGVLNLPHIETWSHFLEPVVGHQPRVKWASGGAELGALFVSALVSLAGLAVAWTLYGPNAGASARIPVTADGMEPGAIEIASPRPYAAGWANALYRGWLMDSAYLRYVASPYRRAASWVERFDRFFFHAFYDAWVLLAQGLHKVVLFAHDGQVSRYAVMMLFGAAAVAAMVVVPNLWNH